MFHVNVDIIGNVLLVLPKTQFSRITYQQSAGGKTWANVDPSLSALRREANKLYLDVFPLGIRGL
jgi:hypothetical protein